MTLFNLFVNQCPYSYAVGMDASFIVLSTKAALKRGGHFWGEAGAGLS